MHWNARLLGKTDLYLILDTQVCGYDRLFEILVSAVAGGVNIVQLRDKSGYPGDMLKFTKEALKITRHEIPFIINDSVELAAESGADGVHLGQEDGPVKEARRILGNARIIGRSCQSIEHTRIAQDEGADYIGFGSVFKTLTKPERRPMDLDVLRGAMTAVDIPLFPIGGITLDNASEITALSLRRLAVCRAVCEASDVAGVVKRFREILDGELIRNS